MPLVCVPLKGVRLSHLSKSYPAFFRVASRAAFFPYLWAAPERGQGGFHHFRASSGAEQREFARGRGHHPPPPSEVRWAGGLRSGTPEQLPPHRRVWIQNASNVLDCQSAWTLPSYTVHLLQNLTCFDDSPGTLAQLPKSQQVREPEVRQELSHCTDLSMQRWAGSGEEARGHGGQEETEVN